MRVAMSEKKDQGPYTRAKFKKDLERVMPGFKWTIHKPSLPMVWSEAAERHVDASQADVDAQHMSASASQSSGMNRLSTLEMAYQASAVHPFTVTVYGYGLRSPKIMDGSGKTVAQAFRNAQDKCEERSEFFGRGASILQEGRAASQPQEEAP